jgi:predicted aspartyl protease
MHALSGTCSKAQTFPLFVQMGDVKMVALIDSGSTTTFLDPSLIEKVGMLASHNKPEKVIVANGGILWTQGAISGSPYTIQGHKFVSYFRVLELSGYDIILGCDWIYDNSLVGINLKIIDFTIEKDGKQVCFQDETLPNKKFLVSHKKMKKLLNKEVVGAVIYVQKLQMEEPHALIPELSELLATFDDIFQEPTELPPARDVDHMIPLLKV